MTNHPALPKRLAAFIALAAFATILHADPAAGFTPASPALEKVTPPGTEISARAVAAPGAPMAPGDCPAEYEPNESGSAAIPFPMTTGALNLAICPVGDADWFSVPMQAGEAYQLETYDIAKGSLVDTQVILYSPDLLTQLIGSADRPGLLEPFSSLMVYTPSQTATYFVKVVAFPPSIGDESRQYTLRVTNLCSERHEPDNAVGQASAHTLGDISHRTLCAIGDQDWVSVELNAGVSYRFETFVNGSTDTHLYLYDMDGTTELKNDDDAGIGFSSLVNYTPTASGTYHVKVARSVSGGSNATGPGKSYQLLIAPRGITTLTITSPCAEAQLDAALVLAESGDLIRFDCGSGPGISPFVFPFSAQKLVSRALTIDGGGLVAFSGLRTNRLLWANPGASLTLKQMSFVRGGGKDKPGGVSNAGGAILSFAPLMIDGSTFSDNYALRTTYGGGALYTNSSITLTNSLLSANESAGGGALYLDAGSRANIRDTQFVSNTSYGAYGGAISNVGFMTLTNVLMSRNVLTPAIFPFGNESGGAFTNYTNARAILISSQLISNTSTVYGGAIGNFSILTITGSTISENRSRNGGGIYAYGTSQLAIVNSAIISNSAIGGSYGGGILNYGTLTLTRINMSLNLADIALTLGIEGGGALANLPSGRVTIDQSSIRDNATNGAGGGIGNRGTLVMANSSIARNSAAFGGGVANQAYDFDEPASVAISNTLVTENSATSVLDGAAGGVYAAGGSTEMTSTRFVSNTAPTRGGGFARDGGMARLFDVTFDGNRTNGNGGGVSIRGSNSRITVDRSLFVRNQAGLSGGGMSSSTPGTWLTNTTFSANSAAVDGGGFADLSQGSGQPMRLVHVSFVGNAANAGGALHRLSAVNTLYMTSTLISRTLDNPGGNCAGMAPTRIANSIASDLTCNVFGPADGGNNLENTDPVVGPLAWNGGATPSHMPLPGSPAIDMAPSGPSRDQRGASRPYGAGYDVGAVEAGPVVPNIFPYSTFVPPALR